MPCSVNGMRCDAVMKRSVHTVRGEDTVFQASKVMLAQDIGFLPICDHDETVLGVITDRDIVLRVCATGGDPAKTLVREVMSSQIIACRPGHPLGHAEALMCKHRKSRVMVTDRLGRICGVLSLSDVVQYESPTRTANALYAIASRKYGSESGP